LASQLAPLYDRFGRLLIDMAPHLAMLGSSIQPINPPGNNPNSASTPINPNLTFASIITNESGQTSRIFNTLNFISFKTQILLSLLLLDHWHSKFLLC
jgi:hypothetical protein